MDVRLVGDRVDARSDAADDRPFGDDGSAQHGDRFELQQRDGVAVRGSDRHGMSAARNRAGEADRSFGGRDDRRTHRRTDVDPSVLTACVRIWAVAERPEHRPVDRPRPRARGTGERARSEREEQHEPLHSTSFVVGVLVVSRP
jgi:hypothetical protein